MTGGLLILCYNVFAMSFPAQIIGHKTAQDVLLRLFAHDRAPHALLLVGSTHVGKTHLATALIQHLLATTQPIEALTDVSLVTRLFDEKTGKRKSQISVKQIRSLTERLSMSSMAGSWKIGFIEEAHHLSMGAANALLKTLEEPKGQTLLILRAPSIESVPATIVSRCQYIRLSIVSRSELSHALQKRGLGPQEADQLAGRSLGRPGLALRYIQDSELRAQKELAYTQARTLFLESALPEQMRSVLELIPKSEADKSRVLSRLLDDWSEALREEMLQGRSKSFHYLKRIQEVRDALPHNINPHLALEHLFL